MGSISRKSLPLDRHGDRSVGRFGTRAQGVQLVVEVGYSHIVRVHVHAKSTTAWSGTVLVWR